MSAIEGSGSPQRPIDRSLYRLLVVNDDPVGRYTTVRLLSAAGFPTVEAATGTEALALADGSLAAIVLDIYLPDIDGLEVCRRLRADPVTRLVPIVHLTAAYLTDEDRVRGLDAGADAYLTHPVDPAVLVSTIQALVRTRTAEEAMRRSEMRFRAVYARVPVGVCLLDSTDGTLLDANPAMLALLHRQEADTLGRTLVELAPPSMHAEAVNFVAALNDGDAKAQIPLLDGHGEPVPLEWSTVPDLEPGLCLAMAVDLRPGIELDRQRQGLLDRERDARSSAERNSRMKDELLAMLSHELRTPLSAITGWTHVLKKRASTELIDRAIASIERNVSIQARLISDILDMSRLNTGKLPLTLEWVDLKDIIEATIGAVQAALHEKGQKLHFELEPIRQLLRVDSARLQQVLWNLLGNAIKFSPEGSAITLRSRTTSGGVAIAVIDQGQGIAPEFLANVFDRFAQSDAATNRQHGGLGLGLAIVKNLVEAMNGQVTVQSDGLGAGATFEVWLPLPQYPAGSDDAQDSGLGDLMLDKEGLSLHGLRILVVDDDLEAGAMLRLILAEHGALVSTAGGYQDALTAMGAGTFDVLISDIGMPGKDGYALMREWRRREVARNDGLQTHAIAFTAFAHEDDHAHALAAGFNAHLSKPLRPHRLMLLIGKMTGRV